MDVETWEDEFYYEIERKVPNEWVFCIDDALQKQEREAQYTQRTFGRFRCSVCKRWWNSAEIHVLFCISLNRHLQQGTVKMRIFKQECKKCNFPKMEKPEISHENIKRITENLVNRIVLLFYGGKKAKQDLKPEVYGREMEGPHDKEHCEACKLKVCRWQNMATKTKSEVKGSPAQMNPSPKPKKQPKVKHQITSSSASPSTATYSYCSSGSHSTYPVVATKTQSEVRGSSAQMIPTSKPKTQPKAAVATKTQSEVRGSSAQMNPTSKPKKQPKAENRPTSSYASPSISTYSSYSLPAYSAYESDFRYSPNYNTGRSAAHSPSSKGEESNFPLVTSLILGIGALALWYLKK